MSGRDAVLSSEASKEEPAAGSKQSSPSSTSSAGSQGSSDTLQPRDDGNALPGSTDAKTSYAAVARSAVPPAAASSSDQQQQSEQQQSEQQRRVSQRTDAQHQQSPIPETPTSSSFPFNQPQRPSPQQHSYRLTSPARTHGPGPGPASTSQPQSQSRLGRIASTASNVSTRTAATDYDLASLRADEIDELGDSHAAMHDFSTRPALRAAGSSTGRTASDTITTGLNALNAQASRSGPSSAVQSRSASASMQRPPARDRTKSRSRVVTNSTSRDASEDEGEAKMASSMSPAPPLRRPPTVTDEDDEVEPIDRGEELVRKRMKDRARQKKEAEKAKRRELERNAKGGTELERRTSQTSALAQTPNAESANPFDAQSTRRPSSQAAFYNRDRSLSRATRATSRGDWSEGAGYATSIASDTGTPTPGSPRVDKAPMSPLPASSVGARDHEAEEDEWYGRRGGSSGEETDASDDDDIDEDVDVEYTLKDRQDAINIEHPFGLPIWKPALYKKSRSVTRNAETALHAEPSPSVVRHLAPVNILWTLFFGIWLAVLFGIASILLWIVPWGGQKYGQVVWELANYLLWPFGKYVEGWIDGDDEDDLTAEPDEDEEDETQENGGLNHANGERSELHRSKSKGYGTMSSPSRSLGQTSQGSSSTIIGVDMQHARPHNFRTKESRWRVRALGRLMYWLVFYLFIAPLMLFACTLCWGMVFTVPMAKLLWVLLRHLNNEPLALHFRSPPTYATPFVDAEGHQQMAAAELPLRAGQPAPKVSQRSIAASKARGRLVGPHPVVLLCTYRAAGWQYYKYTVDGVNIMFINLLSLVFFVIFDFFVIEPRVERHHVGGLVGFVASQGFIFILALLSVIPLSYFIGMAVASISAQSSIGMGAVINASFGSIIEIILYGIALTQAKGELVEGSIVGSILAGVLLMPGASMIGGAMRRKEQRFNARSAGVTSTMLIMAIIGILTPTLFYEIYGSFELLCSGCDPSDGTTKTCRTCYYEHVNPVEDPFYNSTVKLLSYWCAGILVLSYLIGLWFSLRTHASQIWQNVHTHQEAGVGRAPNGPGKERISIYQRMMPQQLMHAGKKASTANGASPRDTPAIEPRNSTIRGDQNIPAIALPHGMTAEEVSRAFQVVAATANAQLSVGGEGQHAREPSKEDAQGQGGHDAPNWSRSKSASVLLACTILYAIIAEILVDVVDVVLQGSGIPEKFLGVTLFALVPNTTEFMNAISFAINGNIALSMEIGSAYALQVCLIQAPAMLAFSSFYNAGRTSVVGRTFSLVVPRWDVIAIIFSVFLLTYVYIEARANYYRGSILCLSYLALMGGFALNPAGRGTSDNPDFTLSVVEHAKAIGLSIFTH